MKWWQGQPEAWQACRANTRPPEEALPEYRSWLEALPSRPVFVASPAGFDFTEVGDEFGLHTPRLADERAEPFQQLVVGDGHERSGLEGLCVFHGHL